MKSFLKTALRPMRLFAGKFAISDRFEFEDSVFRKAGSFVAGDKIDGDFLEFGVFSGRSFIEAHRSIHWAFAQSSSDSGWNTESDQVERKRIFEKMRFIAFDSFEGLPEPKGIDLKSSDFTHGKFKNTRENFETTVRDAGLPMDKVQIVPGWFNESLTPETRERFSLKHAAIVHVDSDLYESAKYVLNFVTPLLVDGSVIIFNDWFGFKAHPQMGEQLAFSEWLSANPNWVATEFHKDDVWRNSFILNRRLD